MEDLIKIPFNVRSRGTLNVGMQYEHNSRRIDFYGWETSATPYFKIDTPVNLMLPLNDNYSLIVTHELTDEFYSTTGQLIGVKSDGTYVNETPLFPVKCLESIGEKPLVEYTTPERDLIYAQAKEAYERYQKYFEQFKMDVAEGKFNGKNYQITEADYNKIAEVTKDKISLANYVEKEPGKGLSTNDYTNEAKQKVDAIPQNPKYTDTVYDDTALKADVAKKANTADIYSKTEADVKFLTEHQDVSMFITKAVTDLTHYYTKSNTYTKTEVNDLITTIPKFNIKVVTELPKTDISSTTIYLLSASVSETDNLYTEYIYVNGKWEVLGSQTLDLSNYVTGDEMREFVRIYVDDNTMMLPYFTLLIVVFGAAFIQTPDGRVNLDLSEMTFEDRYNSFSDILSTGYFINVLILGDDNFWFGQLYSIEINEETNDVYLLISTADIILYFNLNTLTLDTKPLIDVALSHIGETGQNKIREIAETEKKVGYSEVVGSQLLMYSDSTKEHLLATLDLPSSGNVKINGVEVEGNDIPIGTTTNVGAFKVYNNSSSYGIGSNKLGAFVQKASNVDIDVRSNNYKPIVSANLDYTVKAAMCDGKGAKWTSTEKKSAQERIGIVEKTQEDYDIMLANGEIDDNVLYIIKG